MQPDQSFVTADQHYAGIAGEPVTAASTPGHNNPASLVRPGASDSLHSAAIQLPDNLYSQIVATPGMNPSCALQNGEFGRQYPPWFTMEEASLMKSDYAAQLHREAYPRTTRQAFHRHFIDPTINERLQPIVIDLAVDEPSRLTTNSADRTDCKFNVVSRSPSIKPMVSRPTEPTRRKDAALF